MPMRFRRLCQHLALAAERRYSTDLVDRLNRLALRGHHALYANRRRESQQVLDFMLAGFARLVRAEWRLVAAAALLFFGPLVGLTVLLQYFPDFVHYLLSPGQIANFHEMYDPGNRRVGMRESDTSMMMFGYYIWNNVRIGFQTFAGGMLAGVGSAWFLGANGVILGAVSGYLTQVGYNETFWSFVAGCGRQGGRGLRVLHPLPSGRVSARPVPLPPGALRRRGGRPPTRGSPPRHRR